MGPGDVAAMVRAAPGTAPFTKVDAVTFAVVLADPFAGRRVEARYEFSDASHLGAIRLARYDPPGIAKASYEVSYAWFGAVKAELTRALGKAICHGASDDSLYCYWNRPKSDSQVAGLRFAHGHDGYWEVTASFHADDQESAVWRSEPVPDPLAPPEVSPRAPNGLLLAESSDAALRMECSGFEPLDRINCRFVAITMTEIPESRLDEKAKASLLEIFEADLKDGKPVVREGVEKVRTDFCKAGEAVKSALGSESTPLQQRLATRQSQALSDVCACESDECLAEAIPRSLPLFIAECSIRVGPGFQVELLRTADGIWIGRGANGIRVKDHDDEVRLSQTEGDAFRLVWTRTENRFAEEAPKKSTTTWKSANSRRFLPRCGFFEFASGY